MAFSENSHYFCIVSKDKCALISQTEIKIAYNRKAQTGCIIICYIEKLVFLNYFLESAKIHKESSAFFLAQPQVTKNKCFCSDDAQ